MSSKSASRVERTRQDQRGAGRDREESRGVPGLADVTFAARRMTLR